MCSLEVLDEEEISRLQDLVLNVASVDINCTDLTGQTPLMLICQYNQTESYKQCFDTIFKRDDINVLIQNGEGLNALQLLCLCNSENASIQVVKKLVESGINVNNVEMTGNNALHCLCSNTSVCVQRCDELIEVALFLIRCGIDVQAKTHLGDTALTLLFNYSKKKHLVKMASLLAVDHKLDVNHQNGSGENALHLLCQTSSDIGQFMAASRLLIECGIHVQAETKKGDTALSLLCRHFEGPKLRERVHYLAIEQKMDVKHTNLKGENALHCLCINETTEMEDLVAVAQLLINEGADVNAKTKNGAGNALHYVCRMKRCSVVLVRLLIDSGIDVGARDIEGDTPLHQLFRYSDGDENLIILVKMLVNAGVDVNARPLSELSVTNLIWKRHDQLKKAAEIIQFLVTC